MDAATAVVERRDAALDRRCYTLGTMWCALRRPRRSSGRRSADRRFAVLDRVEPGVAWLAFALVTLSIMDAVFTLTLLSWGGSELNPFMDALLLQGVGPFVVVKMALTAVPAFLLAATANVLMFDRVRSRSLLAAATGLYAGLIVYEVLLLTLGS